MHRADNEYCRLHGNPSIVEAGIFYGPVTLAELKRNMSLVSARPRKNAEMISKERKSLPNVNGQGKENIEPKEVPICIQVQCDQEYVSSSVCQSTPKANSRSFQDSISSFSPVEKIQPSVNEWKIPSCLLEASINEFSREVLPTPLVVTVQRNTKNSADESTPETFHNTISNGPLSNTFINKLLNEDICNLKLKEGESAQNGKPLIAAATPRHEKSIPTNAFSSNQKLFPDSTTKSKTSTLKKTLVKNRNLFVNSPVANYIYKGETIRSASKFRHAQCEKNGRYSKYQEQKFSELSKNHAPSNAVKRKLNLDQANHLAKN